MPTPCAAPRLPTAPACPSTTPRPPSHPSRCPCWAVPLPRAMCCSRSHQLRPVPMTATHVVVDVNAHHDGLSIYFPAIFLWLREFNSEPKQRPKFRKRSPLIHSPSLPYKVSTMSPFLPSSFRLKPQPLTRLRLAKTRDTIIFFLKSGHDVVFTSISSSELLTKWTTSRRVLGLAWPWSAAVGRSHLAASTAPEPPQPHWHAPHVAV